VFAFTQVAALILEDPSVSGFARAALVLALVWEAWSAYTWMTNAIDVENAVTRLLMFAAMVAAFFMALAVPDAFADEAVWFAVAYFVVRILNSVLFLWGVRDDPVALRATIRLTPWFVTAAVVALVGGFVEPGLRAWLWLASLAIELGGALVVPLRTRGSSRRHVSPAHFAERYALIVIIALGESIVAVGVATASLDRDVTFALAVVIGFTGVAALWWLYFGFTATALARALHQAAPSSRSTLARDVFTFFHYPVVLGIIFYAVAAKKTLEHPLEPQSDAGRWALGLGVVAFFLGLALMRFRILGRVAWARLAAAAVAFARALALTGADAIAALAVVVGVLVLAIVVENIRLARLREA
jgi:low temperature requirement protein LtrA